VSPDGWRKQLGLPMRARSADLKAATKMYAAAACATPELRMETEHKTRTVLAHLKPDELDVGDFDEHEADAVAIAFACKYAQAERLASRVLTE